MISPVSPRAKASGLTRISVRSTPARCLLARPCYAATPSRARPRAAAARARPSTALPARLRRLAGRHARGALFLVCRSRLGGPGARAFYGSGAGRSGAGRRGLAHLGAFAFDLCLRAPARHAARARGLRHLGLAVGADRPRGLERARAALAALAQLAQAVGAAQVVALDAVLAVRALQPLEL